MSGGWKFMSEDAETISLHDHRMTSVEESGPDLVLHFDRDGFDVARDNALNPTGRHLNTGPAAIILKHWRFLDGVFDRYVEVTCPDGTRYLCPETPLTREMFVSGAFAAEVLDHGWNSESGMLRLDGDGGIYYGDPDTPDGPEGFITLDLYAERVLFCWNSLPRDAWFQDWPGK